ncbi:transposon protein [Panicum miliaceum]|uniref:Transposon protein n=1 Tax=Panicum miliaceum TaxID=4540 RepID=A0A3L6QK11_PANMI|nr:transposon protein [Panicum miliaceum]
MGMRCKKHPFQAAAGVCATCLRDRLLVLAAERNGASSSPAHAQAQAPPAPEPAAFPRSVSPYVSRRKSDAAGGGGALRHHPSLLFFRTPQVGPAYGGGGALEEGDIGYEYEKRRAGKFSVLATLFGHHHRSEVEDKHRGRARERKKLSWLAGIIPRRRKKQAPAAASSSSPPSAPPRRSCRVVSNRGLSPERDSHGSGDESSSPAADPPWRPSPSPMRKTPCRRRQTSSMPSGFAVCLSPLVRPSPGRRHRPVQPPDPGTFSCELRPSPLHSLSSAAPVTRCRSRKLAGGGRFR